MGLDGVELVMAVEERFGIEITNAEAEKIITPGMLVDLIYSKVEATDRSICQPAIDLSLCSQMIYGDSILLPHVFAHRTRNQNRLPGLPMRFVVDVPPLPDLVGWLLPLSLFL